MNEQEQFWAGKFGEDYTARNKVPWRKRMPFWQMILIMSEAKSVLEVGCNIGSNLKAIRELNSGIDLLGTDINKAAIKEAWAADLNVAYSPAEEVGGIWTGSFDLTATIGVLIHIAPDDLKATMESIIQASRDYVLAVEYEAEKEEEIPYRGHAGKLWKRPFGVLYQDLGLNLMATGHAGEGFDNCRYWLMRKPCNDADAA